MTVMRSAGLMAAGAALAVAGVLAWQSAHDGAPEADESVAAAPPIDGPLRMDAATRTRLGIAVTRLVPATSTIVTNGFARALDIGPLAAIDSEIRTARAAAAASAADAQRLRDLAAQDQSASARSVQAAAAAATADRVRVDLAVRRVALEFGPGLARLGEGARMALITDVAAGRAALLRIDVPGSAAVTGVRVGDPAVPVTVLGAASAADPRVQGVALLAILRGPGVREAAAGRQLPAIIAGGGREAGTIVPRAALLRQKGDVFVYIASGNRFERRILAAARPVADGWFTAGDVKPGDMVVTVGAGNVLAAETGAAAAEDE
jgi:hypothetical protein